MIKLGNRDRRRRLPPCLRLAVARRHRDDERHVLVQPRLHPPGDFRERSRFRDLPTPLRHRKQSACRGWLDRFSITSARIPRSPESSGRPGATIESLGSSIPSGHTGSSLTRPESIMIGRAQLLAVDVPCPPASPCAKSGTKKTFGPWPRCRTRSSTARSRTRQLRRCSVALRWMMGWNCGSREAEGQIVGAGRLEPVAGTDFAGIWGGATLEAWRGRGIYRALTAARAGSAVRPARPSSTATPPKYSRPILERSGCVKVSTTTPYHWRGPLPSAPRHPGHGQKTPPWRVGPAGIEPATKGL